ncbi:MAG: cytochrome c biogenesis protein CcdA [Candidatus Heimdallarchaeota archaeon]|nr:MAG: cytochrome c biogenesis protein CcdA [Candidatus Heimdallarchaeota archaeon]
MDFASIYFPILGFVDPDQIGLLIFFLGGLATAISPCLFPILPISLIRMFGADSRKKALTITSVLVSGEILAFLFLFFAISLLSEFLRQNFLNLNAIMGVILIIIGIFLIVPELRELSAKLPNPQLSIGNDSVRYLDAFILGFGYCLIAAPCAGTIFASLTFLILAGENLMFKIFWFPVFALGLALPYYVLAFSASEFRIQIAQWIVARNNVINIGMGFLLVVFGIGMILARFTGTPWWHLYGDALTGVLVLLLLFFASVALIFFSRHRRVKNIKNLEFSDQEFSQKDEKE